MPWEQLTLNGIYCGPAPLPADLWARWNLDPVLLLLLGAAAVMMRHSKTGLAGLAVLAVAFVSPLCALSAALFSARAVHHLLLVAVAAPLFAAAYPGRKGLALAPSFAAFAVVLWAWHVPAAYDSALSHMGVYWLMQLTLLGSAIWFWRSVFTPSASFVGHVPLIVAAFAQMGLLGAILTFAPVPLYEVHAIAPLQWGLLPLTDQQLGGLIMWVPGGIPFAVIAVFLIRRDWSRSQGSFG